MLNVERRRKHEMMKRLKDEMMKGSTFNLQPSTFNISYA